MRVALRIYETLNFPDHEYFDRKFSMGIASHNGKVLSKGMAPFIAPLREGGKLAQACSKRRGESANPNGFCALYSYIITKKRLSHLTQPLFFVLGFIANRIRGQTAEASARIRRTADILWSWLPA